jgi:sulfur carrier protein
VIRVNGEARAWSGGSVGALVDALAISTRGIAVAVDGAVVPRSRWDDTSVADGSKVEIVTAASGG